MYCRKCGKELVDEAMICPYCGVPTHDSGYVAPPPVKRKNGMAVAGFVCSFLIPLLGWIFGGIGLARSKQRGGVGKGFAIAAIVIATVMYIINLLLNISGFTNGTGGYYI